jgi:hypothetical protein
MGGAAAFIIPVGRHHHHRQLRPPLLDPAKQRLAYRGVSIGRWQMVAWDPQRFLAPYAKRFIEELVAHTRRNYPNRDLTRRAPRIPRPKEPTH